MDAEGGALLEELVANGPTGADPRRVIDDSLAVLRVRDLSDRLAEINGLVALGSGEEQEAFMSEKLQIMGEVRALGAGIGRMESRGGQ